MKLPNWSDRKVERPNNYKLQENLDGTYTLIPVPGTVYNPGTPLSATNMQKINSAFDDIMHTAALKTDLTTPFNFKGSCLSTQLNSNAKVNDTWYCTDLKYRLTWNGENWYQSSMNENNYSDELQKAFENIKNNSTKITTDLLADVIYNATRTNSNILYRGTYDTRAVTKHVWKIEENDVLFVDIPANSDYRIAIYLYNNDGTCAKDIEDFWSTTGNKLITDFSGYVSILLREKTNKSLQSVDFENCGLTLQLIRSKETISKTNFTFMKQDGDCTLIRTSTGKNILIDSGAGDETNQKNFAATLKSKFIQYIDYIIISHYHDDHVGNIDYLFKNGFIDNETTFILPPDISAEDQTYLKNTGNYTDKLVVYRYGVVKKDINSMGCNIIHPTENQIIKIDNIEFDFFNTDHTGYLSVSNYDYNVCSLCCYCTINNNVILFGGDLIVEGLTKYQTSLRKCNIFKVNHHGVTSINKLFVSSIYPDVCVIMDSDNTIGRISKDQTHYFVDWCTNEHIPLYVSGILGNIDILVDCYGYKFINNVRRYVYSDYE